MILLDEPSMGLAPQIVEEIFEIVRRLNDEEGVSFLVAEQNTNMALRYATYGYIMETAASSWTARPRCCARTRT
jgi:branched-chain amino acid transport system ATP-binding protein